MPTAITEIELLARLQALLSGNAMGLSAILGDHGGILIERRGHMRGIWRCIGGTFSWTLAGYNEPVHTAGGIDEALHYTRTVILAP